MIANATGCSSIYSGSVPSTPYTTNSNGNGPAWANSLFEDFCEFGLGMYLANEKMRERLITLMNNLIANENVPEEAKAAFREWLDSKDDAELSKIASDKVLKVIDEKMSQDCDYCKTVLALKPHLIKRSHWIIGGDGAAYDIGFGGLDHVLSLGKNVNILVLDTEVYSNTGGQASKSTPVGAIDLGKKRRCKLEVTLKLEGAGRSPDWLENLL